MPHGLQGATVETPSWKVDPGLNYLQASTQKEQLFGLDAGGLLGRPFQEFMDPADAAKIPDLFYREGAPCAFAHVVVRYISATGFLLVVEISGVPLFAEDGALLGFQGVECDLAALPGRTGQEMPALDTIFGLTPIAACVVGRDGRLLAANARHAVLSGRPLMEVIGRHVKDLHRESGEKIVQDFIKLDAGGRIPDHELAIGDREYLIAVTPITSAMNKIIAICVIHLDITERKHLERQLQVANRRLAELNSRDYLTGVYNRRHFDASLAREVSRLGRAGGVLSVALIDVDNFKLFNDRYGHLAGDHCLTAVAKAMSDSLLRAEDRLFRYGGEEFAVLMPHTDEEGALVMAKRLRDAVYALQIPHVDSSWGRVTVSIGLKTIAAVCAYCEHSAGEAIVMGTDKALYRAKANGRNAIAFADKVCRMEEQK